MKTGRPVAITQERIIAAGIAITLPKLNVRAVAQELGVSEMSVYRHVKNVAGLRRVVAEGICARAEFPMPSGVDPRDAIFTHARYLRDFTQEYPGIAEYLLGVTQTSPQVLSMVNAHLMEFAKAYGWSLGKASVIIGAVSRFVISMSLLLERNFEYTPGVAPTVAEWKYPAIAAGMELGSTLGDPWEYTVQALVDGLMLRLADV